MISISYMGFGNSIKARHSRRLLILTLICMVWQERNARILVAKMEGIQDDIEFINSLPKFFFSLLY